MRQIDADELLKDYQTICSSIRCYDCQFNGEWGDKGCQLEAMINNAPTVDPVRHGRWIDDMTNDYYYANCSICGYEMDVHVNRGYHNYCPHCGAKMDEVKE